MLSLLIATAAAQDFDSLVRCTATVRHSQGELEVQAFAADFEAGKAAALEQAWLQAELHLLAGHLAAKAAGGVEWEQEQARWLALDASDPPRIAGVELRPGACERIELPRHSGAWKAAWGSEKVTAGLPWVALENARRRACVAPFEDGLAGDPLAAREELAACMLREPAAPTLTRESLPGPTEAAPRYLCVTPEGDLGGGTTLRAAREDALRARLVYAARSSLAQGVAQMDAVQEGSAAAENAEVLCSGPGRPLSVTTDTSCGAGGRRHALGGEANSAQVGEICHTTSQAPGLSYLPSLGTAQLQQGLATALQCDLACRHGFAASGSFTVALEGE